jgi:hypothetical protein
MGSDKYGHGIRRNGRIRAAGRTFGDMVRVALNTPPSDKGTGRGESANAARSEGQHRPSNNG